MDAVSNPFAAELPPNHRTPPGAAFGRRLQLTASVLAAQERRWRKGWPSLPPLPVVLVVDTLIAALKAGRQAPAGHAPCVGSSPGQICQMAGDGQSQSSAGRGGGCGCAQSMAGSQLCTQTLPLL